MASFLVSLPASVAVDWILALDGEVVGELTLVGPGSQLITNTDTKETIVMSRFGMDDSFLWDRNGVVAAHGMDRLIPKPNPHFDKSKRPKYRQPETWTSRKATATASVSPGEQVPDHNETMTESCVKERAPTDDRDDTAVLCEHIDAVFDKSGGQAMAIFDICKGVQERAPSLSRREITTCVHSICERYGEKKWRLLF
jgi:hypothetical protein